MDFCSLLHILLDYPFLSIQFIFGNHKVYKNDHLLISPLIFSNNYDSLTTMKTHMLIKCVATISYNIGKI